MRMVDFIEKKKQGKNLSKEEIDFIVEGYVSGEIPDYQMSAFLMAVYFQKMSMEETVNLTMAMAHSGDLLDLSGIKGKKVDKHSTGGIGDKTTLVLGPMVAAAGFPVAKMSGRGLGFTGGTIDKLESIPGFSTGMETKQFFSQVNSIGLAVTGQTGNLTPADKKIYALRDVTATVDCIPLIASSIMSKKIASGADVIVLDVKCGSGAFMKDEASASALAKTMCEIGNGVGRRTMALVSDMDQPLGFAVGNSLEVMEAIQVLSGKKEPADLRELCLQLGSYMIHGSDSSISVKEAYERLEKTLEDGSALEKFRAFVQAQGGNQDVTKDFSLFPQSKAKQEILATQEGYITHVDAMLIGEASMVLGAGRAKKGDDVNLAVGVVLHKKVNDYVKVGEPLVSVYYDSEKLLEDAKERINAAFTYGPRANSNHKLIHQLFV
ncbi:MAG: pyrimidine-nucleoside phosphorylase [Lachnospiraceae bacterium]|nr:pyrimidine-nucleoside phosphorylase [Lachnospiraceae bacterium]